MLRSPMACLFGSFLFAFAIILTQTGVTDAQRGQPQAPTCVQPRPGCNFSTAKDEVTECDKELDYCIFKPTLPGNYTFEYVAEDLCDGKVSQTQTLEVKCPPEPTANITVVPKTLEVSGVIDILQGTALKFDASGSSPNSRWSLAPEELTYDYCITAPDAKTACHDWDETSTDPTPWKRITSADRTFDIPSGEIATSGDYSITLKVDDGCSFGQITKCFKVRCNCGPTANAQATVSTYSNMHYDGRTFMLDGSKSYDFDGDVLQYTWKFLQWEPAPKMPFSTLREPAAAAGRRPFPGREYLPDPREGALVWQNDFKKAATATTFGYEVRPEKSNTDLLQTYTFVRTAKITVNPEVVESTETSGRGGPETVTTKETCATYGNNKEVNSMCALGKPEDTRYCAFDDISAKCKEAAAYPRWVAARVYSRDGSPAAKDHSLYFNDGGMTGAEENFQANSQQAIMNGQTAFKDWKTDGIPNGRTDIFDPVTTSCVAYVEKTVAITTLTQKHTNVTTRVKSAAGQDYSFCEITIRQQGAAGVVNKGGGSTNPQAEFTIRYPEEVNGAELMPPLPSSTVGAHAYEMCRGVWSFQLTVFDQCGAVTADTDTVSISVRCNKPPVAVLCCNTTVVYSAESSAFPQVTLDGRSSNDGSENLGTDCGTECAANSTDYTPEGDELTYYWNFLQVPADHLATCLSESPAGEMLPCQQSYCQLSSTPDHHTFIYAGPNCPANAPKFTDTFSDLVYRTGLVTCLGLPGAGDRNVAAYSRWGQGNDRCGPHVYRPIYDMAQAQPANCVAPGLNRADGIPYCTYGTVGSTGAHSGNSAYFVPSKPGQYVVQLAVHDGCSTTVDTTTITAVCPAITGSISVSPRTGFFYPPGSGETSTKVELKSSIQYEGDLQKSVLSYRWNIVAPAGVTYDCASDCKTAATSFTPQGRGTFTVSLEVADGCQSATVIGSSVTVLIACNTPPIATPLNIGTGRGSEMYPTGTRTIDPADAQTTTQMLDAATQQFPSVTIIGLGTDADQETLTTVWSITDAQNASAPVNLRVENYPESSTSNNKLIFSPAFSSTGGNAQNLRYLVTYRVRDGCQESEAISARVAFSCDTSMRVSLNPSTPLRFEYDYTSSAFGSKSIDAASNSIFPYQSQVKYTWRLRDGAGTDLKEAADATQANSATLSWTPAATRLNQYRIDLSVSDGCTTQSIQTTAESVCPTLPIARLELDGTPNQIQWDSRGKDLYTGKFPEVKLSGTGGASSVPIKTYVFSVLNPEATDPGVDGKFTYQPLSAGTYEFRLKVANGPCESPSTPSVIVTAICLRLGFSMKTTVGSVTAPSPAAFVSTWNGVRFQNVDLDATDVTYRDNQNVEGNYNSLRYTWLVDLSPAESMFEPSNNGAMVPVGYANIGVTESIVVDNSTYFEKKTDYMKVSRTASLATTTTLMNHHYNRPMTCFRPDIRGSYSLTLKIEDGCVDSVTMPISIQAQCTAPIIVPQPRMSDGSATGTTALTTTLSGYTFKRITFDARTTAPNSGVDTLTYQWTVVPLDGLKNANTDLTNPHGNIASFVPRQSGRYRIEFKVFDGCNDLVSPPQEMILTVQCPAEEIPDYQMILQSFDKSQIDQTNPLKHAANAQLTDARAEIRFMGFDKTKPNVNAFQDKFYKLAATPDKPCRVKKAYFRYVPKRQCTTPYDLSAAPPAAPTAGPCPQTKHVCRWSVTEYPCSANAANADFLAPKIGGTDCPQKLPADGSGCKGDLQQQDCNVNFMCRSAGTYKLELTVDDGCSVITESTTVTCKCQNVLQAKPPLARTVTYQCDTGDNTYKFAPETLVGKFEVNTPRDKEGFLNMSCPSVATPAPVTPPMTSGSCCPTPEPCPACAACQSCSCSGAFAGSAPAPSSHNVVPGSERAARSLKPRQAFHARQETTDESLTVMLGTAVPIAAVTVISLIANIVLFKIYQSEDE